jgi:hypothetical protein
MSHTIASRRRVAHQLDQLNAVLEAMKGGAALHFSGTEWFLLNGRVVDATIAQAVIRHPFVVGVGPVDVGDALFGDTVAQTYRYVDNT